MPRTELHPARTPRAAQRRLEHLSPFELKDKLIALAAGHARASTAQMLNAGRGNPNWIATAGRDAFFLLGRFAMQEARRTWDAPGLAGMPSPQGIATRLRAFLRHNAEEPGAELLRAALDYGTRQLGFEPDAFAHELTDAVVADNYPVPPRMLVHCERIVHEYLIQEVCDGRGPSGRFDLFATEGATAAICYIFDSLAVNGLLERGSRIALGTPIFTPYVEIPRLERYGLEIVPVQATETRPDGSHAWQYPDSEIEKLADHKVKAFFLVNPSNPPSVAMRPATVRRLVKVIRRDNPDLIIITDDVYATFVPGFRSLMAELPHNTIGVYSFSKNFGCTGWRLGVVAIHESNVLDRMLARLPARRRSVLGRRYASLSLQPERLKFIDRLVADSRQVALNHTAGLSLPQQAQMTLFAISALVDRSHAYDKLTRSVVQRRYRALFEGLRAPLPEDPMRAGYYADLDLLVWARREYGEQFVRFLERNYQPVDLLFRLAEQSSIVLMHGGGFDGPKWSVRVSLANLPDEAYGKIGHYLRLAAETYVQEWKAAARRPLAAARRARTGG